MALNQWVGIVLASIGLVSICIGIFGLYMYDNFYTKVTVASLIDSVGFLFITLGVIVYKGLSNFSLKVLFLLILIMLLNPLANHYIVRGAHTSGYRPEKED